MIGASVCSGIGGAEVAAPCIDWKFCSEIEAFPSAVMNHHFPHVPNQGNLENWREWNVGPVDIICGGTPCQSFSSMGRGKGLEDARGNLTFEFLRLAAELGSRWIVWENVPGVLSSGGGRDFGAILGALAKFGYGCAWRCIDVQMVRSRNFPRTIPQRRRRVYLVGCSGSDFRSASEALLVAPRMQGHPPSGGRTWPRYPRKGARDAGAGRGGVAHCLRASTGIAVAAMSDNFLFDDIPRWLTPSERERLMGFPVGYTDIPWKHSKDGARHKALGNAWCVSVIEWIMDRIMDVNGRK